MGLMRTATLRCAMTTPGATDRRARWRCRASIRTIRPSPDGETRMPTYEYQCEANGRIVEVQHKMAERIRNWGQLCERAGIAAGRTDPKAPVTKLISAGFIGSGCAAPE